MLEFKRSLSRDLGRELCAFANASGGVVLIGVSDTGEVVGVSDHNRLKSRVQSIARSADPPIEVEVDNVGEILLVVVPPQKRKPYSFGGRFFLREGANSQQMSNAEVEDLFYAVGRLHFDRTPCVDFSLDDDLDEETWRQFGRRAKVPEAMDRVVVLRNLGLLDSQDCMTHAGAWLLAHNVRRFTTCAYVSCALFMGTGKLRILDRRDFYRDVPTTGAARAPGRGSAGGGGECRGASRLPFDGERARLCLQGPGGNRQSRRVAGGNDGGGFGLEEHAAESVVVRHVVPDGRGGEHRFRHQAHSGALPGARGGGADHQRLRVLGDGDLLKAGPASCIPPTGERGCCSREERIHGSGRTGGQDGAGKGTEARVEARVGNETETQVEARVRVRISVGARVGKRSRTCAGAPWSRFSVEVGDLESPGAPVRVGRTREGDSVVDDRRVD